MRARKKEELNRAISELVAGLSYVEKKAVFNEVLEAVPLSIFKTNLSGLEAIVFYLKEVRKLKVKEISKVLKRNVQTIYSTYKKASIKKGEQEEKEKKENGRKKVRRRVKTKFSEEFFIPLNIFSNRKFSVLESLVFYLKDEEGLTLVRISELLGKSASTIKTVNGRYKKKCLSK